MTAIDEAGQLLAQARARRDSHYPDAAAAAAEAVPQPGPARDACAARIRADWDQRLAQVPGRDGVSPGAVTTGHARGAGGMGQPAPLATPGPRRRRAAS